MASKPQLLVAVVPRNHRTNTAGVSFVHMASTLVTPEQSRLGRFRQAVRNPSIGQVILAVFVMIAIPAAIFGPGIYRNASDGLADINQRQQTPSIAPAPGTWINPWLRDKAAVMMGATLPIHWRIANFESGPCHPRNLSLLPKDKWSAAIVNACGQMQSIQVRYAASCAETSACVVPEDARRELQGVVDYLVTEFDDAGMVQPYQITEESD